MSRFSKSFVLVISASIFIFGFFIGNLAHPNPTEDLKDAPEIRSAPLSRIIYKDPIEIKAKLGIEEIKFLAMNKSGMITDLKCKVDSPVENGKVFAEVNGEQIISLYSSYPFYRDLFEGDTGKDVKALRESLIKLGYNVPADGSYDSSISNALKKLKEDAGVGSGDENFYVSDFMWIPEENFFINSCNKQIGQQYLEGEIISESVPKIENIDFYVPSGHDLGERELDIFTQTVSFKEGRLVDSSILELISTSEEYISYIKNSEKTNEISVLASLKYPIEAYQVPPSALFGIDNKNACVQSELSTHRVKILGSSLGSSIIQFENQNNIPREILLGSSITESLCPR